MDSRNSCSIALRALVFVIVLLVSAPSNAQGNSSHGEDCLDWETNGCMVEPGKVVCASFRGIEVARSDMNAAQLESLSCVKLERPLTGTSSGRPVGGYRRLVIRTETSVTTIWAYDGNMKRRE